MIEAINLKGKLPTFQVQANRRPTPIYSTPVPSSEEQLVPYEPVNCQRRLLLPQISKMASVDELKAGEVSEDFRTSNLPDLYTCISIP